jgi:hypothetical protein
MEKIVMNLLKKLGLAIAILASVYVIAGDDDSVSADRGMESIHKFVDARSNVELRNKLVDFTLCGDLRLRTQHFNEKVGGTDVRGSDTAYPSSVHQAEFNLLVDYETSKTWASVLMRFKNDFGSEHLSGTMDKVSMKKALAGYRVYEEGNSCFSIRAGRDSGYAMFDSRVQFDSNFDGIWARYEDSFAGICDTYVDFGPLVVSDIVDHYAWVAETGFTDLAGTGAFFKYSFINWSKDSKTINLSTDLPENKSPYWQFRNHQVLGGYILNPEIVGAPVKFYGAYGVNTDADANVTLDSTKITGGKKANKFWYAGITTGDILKSGWAVDLCYQAVGAQAVPDIDISGISNGNVQGNKFYDATTKSALGRGNYKGWALKSGYALTENMVLGFEYENSRAKDTAIGGQHKYSKAQVEAIYAF